MKYYSLKFATILLLFLFSSQILLYADVNDDIRKLTDKVMSDNKIPGLELAIVLPDNKAIIQYHGTASLTYDVPVSGRTIFSIGSISKVFVTLGILKLNQEGRLSLEDKLSKYFPEYPKIADVKIVDILHHSSGLKDILLVEPFKSNLTKDWTSQEIIGLVSKMDLDFKPGSKIQYDDTGYIFLGEIISKVSGMKFQDYIRKNITGLLGMENTYFADNYQIIKNFAGGYDVKHPPLRNAEYASLIMCGATGGMVSNVADLVKLKQVFDGEKIINRKSVEDLFRQNTDFDTDSKQFIEKAGFVLGHGGYSFELLKCNDKYFSCKFGGFSGFTALLIFDKHDDIMIVILTNADSEHRALAKLATGIFGMIIKK